jgi:hypothetical protein
VPIGVGSVKGEFTHLAAARRNFRAVAKDGVFEHEDERFVPQGTFDFVIYVGFFESYRLRG